ncbi:hypothetical protein JNL27_10795 [bacterium]|nr:hypothetical protein [bacterium]
MKVVFFFLFIASSNLYSQSIVDNEFAFGFDNIFGWNTVVLEKQVEDAHVRMIMFNDITTIKNRMIMFDLQEIKDKPFTNFIDSGLVVIDSIINPYGRQSTLIIASAKNPVRVHALIDHFGFVLRVSLNDSEGIDMTKFRKLIETYINLRLDF